MNTITGDSRIYFGKAPDILVAGNTVNGGIEVNPWTFSTGASRMNIFPDKNFYPDKLWFRIHEDDASLVSITEIQEQPADVEYFRRDLHESCIAVLHRQHEAKKLKMFCKNIWFALDGSIGPSGVKENVTDIEYVRRDVYDELKRELAVLREYGMPTHLGG